jgi:ureidoglycolate dehydrogenase (NAD+)
MNDMQEQKVDTVHLRQWVSSLFQAIGVSSDSADATAESLVDADLRGVGTHGVVRVPIYIKRLQLGVINKHPVAQFHEVGAAAQRLDGDNGLGQWVGLTAIERACDLAETTGIGMVLATRSNHFGTAGWFARKANERGFAALVLSQCESLVVPFGGTERFFGTNPLCLSMPLPDAEPITLDMATSAVPLGKIETAKVTTGQIPPDWAVDASGQPTTDPHQAYALQPMAGPKGSGLAMLIDLLSGGLAGTECGPRIHRMYDDFEHEHNLAHTFIAIKTEGFSAGRPPAEVVTDMVADLRQQKPAQGFTEVLLPGENEARLAARKNQEGIALAASLIESLSALGAEHGTAFPTSL